MQQQLTVVQALPALNSGGVERGTIEVATELVKQGHRAIVVSAGGRMLPQLLDCGAEHINWPIGKKSLSTFRYIWPLRMLLREQQVDILHVRSRLPAWIGWHAWRGLAAHTRPHFVSTVHGPYSVSRYSSVMTRGERVIATSETIRDYITTNYSGVDPANIRLIYRGIAAEEFPYAYQPSTEWQHDWQDSFPELKNKFILTIPARITRWKGQSEFIDMIATLHRRGHTDTHGLIVGDAEQRRQGFLEKLQQQISTLNLEDHITFAGHRSDMRDVMASSDILFSITNEPEAFGRTTAEALCLGKPVIGYNHGGTGEILRQVFQQGIIPVGDIESACDRIVQIRNTDAIPEDNNPFTLKRMLDSTLAVYYELISGTDKP